MNQPNRIESWILEPEEKLVTITEDPKVPNAATIFMRKQDHTMGNMIRAQLLLDPTVLFAGYKVPHPLENNILLKIQTDERSNPADAFKRACFFLINQIQSIKEKFVSQANIMEMGLGPEVGSAARPGAVGPSLNSAAYDPYGDGFGTQTQPQTQGGQDVYDF